MKTRLFLYMAALLVVVNGVQAQSPPQVVDCSCLRTQAVLMTNACIGYIPDLCQFTNCFISTVTPPPTFNCSQNPAPGGPVGPGTYSITVTVAAMGAIEQCTLLFTVNAPQTGPFALICNTNKTVECGSNWNFDPPTPTNYCCPVSGVPGNGVTITVVSTTTNGTCPEVITQTWKGVDDCGHTATCSQTVTVVDTTPPTLNCNCLRNPAVFPTTVTACSATIPNFCLLMSACASDNCGPLTCTQSPAAGTGVGPGTHPVTVTVTDCAGSNATCVVVFTVISPQNGPFALLCAPNKTVECGTTWSFDPPTYTNNCCPPSGTVPNVTITVVSTTTNGSCPMVITRTWQGVDDCGATATCSQTVTVVDTTPPVLDCNCLRNSAATPPLTVTGCTAVIPNLCALASTCTTERCGPLTCAQSPAAGTPVGPGTHPITVTVTDCAGNSASCTIVFTVNGPQTGPFALICAPNKTVECNTTWTFDPPIYTNACCPPAGTTGNVTVSVLSTTTNGTCPEVITRTWRATDACGNIATCSQTVTVVDTTPPVLDCNCLSDPASVQLTVVGCTNRIPNLCLLAPGCATDNCGPLTCSQTPAAGTIVGPGTYPITVTVTDCANNSATCTIVFTVVAPSTGCCTNMTNIWNTGMGGTSGNVALAPGTPDPNYTLVSMPAGSCVGPAQVLPPGLLPGVWVPNGPNSQWIGAGPNVDCQSGMYHYRITFYVPCADTASIVGQWTADDWAEMRLNGALTGHSVPSTQFPNTSFAGWHPVNITNGFLCGTNTLDIFVTNATFAFDNPTGLRAELTNVFNDCCCEPAANPSTTLSGVGPSGLLAPNSADPQFALTCAPPGVTATTPVVVQPSSIPGGWIPNGPNSQWISHDQSAIGPAGVYCYTLRFDLPCPPGTPITGALTGQWAADNTGTIHVNGNPTGNTLPNPVGFAAWQPINITSGFVPGLNTVTFYVTNHGSFVGLRLELTNSVNCCDCGPCTLTCPQDITVTTCRNQEVVFYPMPTLSGSCDPNATIVCNPPSGSAFPANTSTLVTCTATDSSGATIGACTFAVTVISSQTGPFALVCAPNKTVECGTTWSFDPPIYTNNCCPPSGTAPNVTITVVSTTTNGTCPEVITRTWQGVDDCGATATCSQTVTVVDTTSPVLDCNCLQDPASVQLSVVGCTNPIPNLCLLAPGCATDNCGPLTCTQTPAAGTMVGPGTYPITVTVTDCAGNSATCTVVFTVVAPAGGCCTVTTNAWNTGMGGPSGNVALAPGTPDPNYTLVSMPAGSCTGPAQVLPPGSLPGSWVPNGPNSQWIGAGPSVDCQPGMYHYRITFFVPCADSASIMGQWTADDWAEMRLNGVPTGHTVPSTQFPNVTFAGWHPVNITNGFLCGTNTLDIFVTNAHASDNPTGLRAQLTNVFDDCCCGPTQNVVSVFSGADANGLIPAGAPDNQFWITCAPPGVSATTPVVINPGSIPGGWIPNGPNSQWIGADQFATGVQGVYCYTFNFIIPCPPHVTIKGSLTGQWAADNTGSIILNGAPTGNTLPSPVGFASWQPINVTSGFLPGLNQMTLFVTNHGGPTGLRLELTGSFSCCDCVDHCSCDFTNGNFTQAVATNGTGGGWTSSGLFSGNGWQPTGGNPGGTFLLNNVGDPNTDPTISQQLCCLKPGQCYTIKGQRKVQAWFGQTAPSFAVLLDGVPILILPVPTNPADTNWHNFSVSFTATNACQTIGFASEFNGTDVSYWIDNIKLECCDPTPCTITCPQDITVTTCRNQETVFYPLPTLSGSCDPNAVVTCNPPSGSSFPANTSTLVTCNVTSGGAVIATCTFAVTVIGDTRPPTCPPSLSVTGCPPRMPDFSTNIFITDDCTPQGQITVTQNILPGTPLPPNTSTIVIVTVCDQAGNCLTCDVGVTAYSTAKPVKINCPKDMTVLTCSNSAVVKFKATANLPPATITCTPPSGSTFPLGTNFVTCCVTNICGDFACCTFTVVVKPALTVNPTVVITAGLPDNFAGGIEPSPQNACMVSAFAGFPFWKGFDATANNTLLGHRFTGLPNNILQAELIIRMRPGDDSGSDNDGLFIGLGPSCTFASFLYGQSIKALPGASPPTGSTWVQASNGPTTFTLNLGALNPAFINKLNTDQFLDVVVHDDTTVDYMRLRLWVCPPKHPGIGIPYDIVGGATVAQKVPPVSDAPVVGPQPPGLCIFPNPNNPVSGILLHPGSPRAATFTTHLDFNAPAGATMGVALPGGIGAPAFEPMFTFRKCEVPGCGYDLKINKRLFVSDSGNLRSTAISRDGDLVGSFSHAGSEPDLENFARFNSLPGVTTMWVTVTLDYMTGEVTLQIPDCIWTPDNARKGWDGCIYGNGTPSKPIKNKGSGRLILTPDRSLDPQPLTSNVPFLIAGRGFEEIGVEDPTVTSQDRKWGDGHVTLMKAYDDGETDRKIEWISLGAESGVNVELGRSASFELGIHHFEIGDIPNEEQILRIFYPPGPLTNRPPRDVLQMGRRGAFINFTCQFDNGRYVTIQLWRNGVKVKEQTHVDTQVDHELGQLSRWTDFLGRPHSGGLSLRSDTSFAVLLAGDPDPTDCDDLRIIPEREPGTLEHPYITGLEIQTSDGMESMAYDLRTTLACPPTPARLNIIPTSTGTTLQWFDDCYILQGAEDVTGPWYDLTEGDLSADGSYQVTLPSQGPQRMYRLKQVD